MEEYLKERKRKIKAFINSLQDMLDKNSQTHSNEMGKMKQLLNDYINYSVKKKVPPTSE